MNITVRTHVIAFVALFFFVPVLTHAEAIESFRSVIEINTDSSFTVTETIDYVFTDERHGIFRDIPKTHAQESSAWFRERYLEIEPLHVLMDGESVPYDVGDTDNGLSVRIGDPNETIIGRHQYEISYLVRGGLSYSQNFGVELYWNVTGFEWEVPIRRVEVVISGPEGLFTNNRACYRGYLGDTKTCARTSVEGTQITFEAERLAVNEGVTIAQGINPAAVERVILERANTFWFWVAGILIWFLALIYFVYRYRTEYETGNPIIVQYEPYQDFKPMYTGLLFDGTLHPEDITACIVYLAQQGFLKIRKTTDKVLFLFEVDDYEIELLRSPTEIESPFQREILRLLFGNSVLAGSKIKLSDLKTDTMKQKENQTILRELKKALEKDLEREGFFQVSIPAHVLGGIVVGIFVAGLILSNLITAVTSTFIIIVVVIIMSLIILAFMYRRRTRKGYEALDYLEGFRDFLSVTEEERYAFHNAPTKSPERFMEYLPYAIAFGVEKEWAEVFKDVTIPDPQWYDSGGAGHFSAVNLTTSLGAFSTAFASSSGSSGGGAGGGGSAGGGGGGGGGGSW